MIQTAYVQPLLDPMRGSTPRAGEAGQTAEILDLKMGDSMEIVSLDANAQ